MSERLPTEIIEVGVEDYNAALAQSRALGRVSMLAELLGDAMMKGEPIVPDSPDDGYVSTAWLLMLLGREANGEV